MTSTGYDRARRGGYGWLVGGRGRRDSAARRLHARRRRALTGPKGAPIRRGNFNPLVGWMKAVEAIGAPGLHFHALRHTGNTLAAATGVSTRDLMARMGHDSMNAAIIYQHATREADRVIADGLDARMRTLREPAKKVNPDPDEGENRDLAVTG